MSMLAELVEVVIGVDTHSQTHTAAVLDARTGGVLARATVTADPDGYAELVALAEQHSGLRAWAMEGAGGYGAGLARHLAAGGEMVVELDRPKRPARRAGAKSDPIDAERDALARTRLAQPKTGAERAALQMRLTARPPWRPPAPASGNCWRWSSPPLSRWRPLPRPEHPRDDHHRRQTAPRRQHRRHRGDRADRAPRPGRPHPLPRGRGTRPRKGHPHHRPLLAVRPARVDRSWTDRGRHRAHSLVPPRPLPQRRGVRHARRHRPHPGVLGQDRPLPAQPLRGPPTQPCPAHRDPQPPAPGPVPVVRSTGTGRDSVGATSAGSWRAPRLRRRGRRWPLATAWCLRRGCRGGRRG